MIKLLVEAVATNKQGFRQFRDSGSFGTLETMQSRLLWGVLGSQVEQADEEVAP